MLAAAGLLLAQAMTSEAEAQSSAKVRRIGILTVGEGSRLREELRELGYVEGRSVAFDIRNVDGRLERIDEFAAELVRLKVDVIVAAFPTAVFAARRATGTIPIVMLNTPDPVQLGLVASLAHPGGNITGTTSLSVDVSVKQLELLREAIPGTSRIAVLWNPDNRWHALVVQDLGKENRIPGVRLQILPLRDPKEFEGAFALMARERADAVLILADPMMGSPANRSRLTDLAVAHRLPSMGGPLGFAGAGGMMAYWADEGDLNRRVASYVDRILKGAKPEALPIEQPTSYRLLINLKTARALGRTIPAPVLLRATVIE